jgi:hypothetical protein
VKGLLGCHSCNKCAEACDASPSACSSGTCGHAACGGNTCGHATCGGGGCAACGHEAGGCATCGREATGGCAACGHEACGCGRRECGCRSCESHPLLDLLEDLFHGESCGHHGCQSPCVASCGSASIGAAGGCSTCGGEVSSGTVYSGANVAPSVPMQTHPGQPVAPPAPRPSVLPKAPPMPPAPRGDPSAFMGPSQTIYSSERGVVRD